MKRRISLIAIICMALMLSSVAKDRRSESLLADRKQNFDAGWLFRKGDISNAQGLDFNDRDWDRKDLPHDWSIEETTDILNTTGNDGGYFPAGIGWYRKTFSVPEEWRGREVSIYFEGVYMNAEVFINGQSLGTHPYGFTSFRYDLTPYLKVGKSNTLAVKVDNSSQKNCRWYSGSGIYRHVWLEVYSPAHIAPWGVAITTRLESKQKANILLTTTIKNESSATKVLTLLSTLKNKKGSRVGTSKSSITIKPKSQSTIVQNITLNRPALWSIEEPTLYVAESVIMEDGKLVDMVQNEFGVRSIKFSAEGGFELNGKSLKINGGCVHHDNGCLGAKAYDRAEEKKVELLKEAGFNLVRTSHNPPSEAFLRACDRFGLLVIDEIFDGWREKKNTYDYSIFFDEWWQRDVESMVLRDRNHPSIIMWSSGNEIIERTSPEAVKTAKMLNGHIRKLDATRPVTSAMTSWNQGWSVFDSLMAAHDVCGYNYMMQEAEGDHKRAPSRVIIQTESYPKDAFYNWSMVQNHSYIIGDIVWTALDYLGESSIGRYYYPEDPEGQHWEKTFFPWHGAYCGDIDITGWRKPISHYRSMLWNNTEKLYMAVKEPNPSSGAIKTTMWAVWPTWECWTWPGYDGKSIEVEVYSKYPSVKLFLNGKLMGEKPTGREQEYKAVFVIPYSKGEIKAVAYANGRAAESRSLKTANEPKLIALKADRAELVANGQDLSYITVEVCDRNGVINPNADNHLTCTIEGEGEIVGVSNANMKDTTSYVGKEISAWKGRALVVVKSTHHSGEIKLHVSSPNLNGALVVLKNK